MYRKILIVLEENETDKDVLAQAGALAAQMNAAVIVLRVITVADEGGGGLGLQFQLELDSGGWRRKDEAGGYAPESGHSLDQLGLNVELAQVVSVKSKADEIVSYATSNDCDLIAMARESRPWYKRWTGASTANAVLRKTTIPVLMVSGGTRVTPETSMAPDEDTVMAMLGSAIL
jgi:nucleotide-binding universal stress UspA family protein